MRTGRNSRAWRASARAWAIARTTVPIPVPTKSQTESRWSAGVIAMHSNTATVTHNSVDYTLTDDAGKPGRLTCIPKSGSGESWMATMGMPRPGQKP